MKKTKYYSSRRETPWDDQERDPLQDYIRNQYLEDYDEKHPSLKDTNEAAFLNFFKPLQCPICGSPNFTKKGFRNGVQQYLCPNCGHKFTILTGSLVQDHKLPISEWIEFCLNLFRHDSISSTSANNKNSQTTSAYWRKKLFMLLQDYHKSIILKGNVYIDETFYNELISCRKLKNGKELRGISNNKYCIAIGYDGTCVYAYLEGKGKPTQEKTLNAFKNHIAKGSNLIHDSEKSHQILLNELNLTEEKYNAREISKMTDKDNPLYPINHQCFLLKDFLNAHPGFNREELQGYLDLFCFMQNPPRNRLNKIEILIRALLYTRKTLKFRDAWKKSNDK